MRSSSSGQGLLMRRLTVAFIVACMLMSLSQNKVSAAIHLSQQQQYEANWGEWTNLGGTLTEPPGATATRQGKVEVFGRGTDGALYQRSWSGQVWSGWVRVGGSILGSPAATSWPSGRIDVFARGRDNALWQISQVDGQWGDWVNLGGLLASNPAVTSWGEGRIDVFMRGADGALWRRWFDDGKWSDWEIAKSDLFLISAPAAATPYAGRIDVIAVRSPQFEFTGTQSRVVHTTFENGRWNQWRVAAGESGGVALTALPGPTLYAFQSAGGWFWYSVYQNGHWPFFGWSFMGLSITRNIFEGAPTVTSFANNLHLFARDRDNNLWYRRMRLESYR
jgi:hypothetical protein